MLGYNIKRRRIRPYSNVHQYDIWWTRISTEKNSRKRSRIQYSTNKGICKSHVKFTKATSWRNIKILPKLQNIVWLQGFSNDYLDINQVVRNTIFRKIRDIIPNTKKWKRNKKYLKLEIVFFNLPKSCIVERFPQCKGVTLEVKFSGRFKVFLRDSCIKKIYTFDES